MPFLFILSLRIMMGPYRKRRNLMALFLRKMIFPYSLCLCILLFLIIITQVGCSNEFDKQYDELMVSARLSFQKKSFDKAAEKFYKASQIHGMSDDNLNRQKALIGFFESCYYMESPERERFLTKLKSSLPSMPAAEQESFFFLSTGNSQIDNSVIAEIRSSAAEILRKHVNPQVNWREALALELRIFGVAVKSIETEQIIIDHQYYD